MFTEISTFLCLRDVNDTRYLSFRWQFVFPTTLFFRQLLQYIFLALYMKNIFGMFSLLDFDFQELPLFHGQNLNEQATCSLYAITFKKLNPYFFSKLQFDLFSGIIHKWFIVGRDYGWRKFSHFIIADILYYHSFLIYLLGEACYCNFIV